MTSSDEAEVSPPCVRVSVLVAVKNEASNLPACLESVRRATEVVVVDSASSDGTTSIARNHGAQVLQYPGLDVAQGMRKRNWALGEHQWANPWVFIVDADERISDGLWDEIKQAVDEPAPDGFYVPFKYMFMGTWIRHCGWWPGYQLRLFRHAIGRYETIITGPWAPIMGDVEVHERVMIPREPGRLRQAILHEDYRGLGNWLDKHNRYSTWEAAVRGDAPSMRISALLSRDFVTRHRAMRSVWVRLPARPLLLFLWMYLFRRGYLDGRAGLRFSLLHAIHQWHVDMKSEERPDG